MSADVGVGQYIKTPRGPGLVTAIDWERCRYHVTVEPESSLTAVRAELWVDMEKVVPSDVLDVDLHDIDTVEKYLAGEDLAPEVERPKAAFNIPCAPLCGCTWCNRISSNGFHMHNTGMCGCEKNGCPCLKGETLPF